MNSVQESKNELDAAIRYAENAISSAKQTIESMEFRQEMAQKNYQEQTGREAVLESELAGVRQLLDKMTDENVELEERNDKLNAQIVEQIGRIAELEAQVNALEQPEQPTMPVIPRDVAIAIFRKGTLFGVEAACDEIEGEEIRISETGYTGDFEVSFEHSLQLDDYIDFDWVRSKIGDYDEGNVTANLEGLCAKNNFECRIHGIDDQEEKKNG